MKHVTDTSVIASLAKTRRLPQPGETIPMTAGALPEDATLCPWCYGREDDCRKCDGSGRVCPTCRGAHTQTVKDSRRPSLIGCRDCTDWIDQQQHRWGEHGWPLYQRAPQREAAVIRYYWRTHEVAS